MEKIKFKDLNKWLKVLVVFGWTALGYWVMFLLTNLVKGIASII